MRGAEAGTAVERRLVADGELAEVMSDHLSLNKHDKKDDKGVNTRRSTNQSFENNKTEVLHVP